jgi:hypothetical protein
MLAAGCRSAARAVMRAPSTGSLLLVLRGHSAGATASGVEEPHSGRLATADADLPSLSYGHLVGDSAGPARRGQESGPASQRPATSPAPASCPTTARRPFFRPGFAGPFASGGRAKAL